MAIVTSSVIPQPIQTFYDRVLLERALPYLAHNLFGQQRPVSLNSGDAPKFRRYSSLTQSTAPLTEGVTPASASWGYTDVTGHLKQYGNWLEIADFIQLTSQDRVVTEASEVLGENAGESLDSIYRDVLAAGSSVFYANSVAGRSSIITKLAAADFNMILRSMRTDNCKYWKENPIIGTDRVGTSPIPASYFAIAHPYTCYDLEGVLTTSYTKVHQYSDPKMALPNEHGAYKSIRFIESTNAKIVADSGGTAVSNTLKYTTSSAAADIYCTLIFGQNAYGITPLSGNALKTIVKSLGSGGTADPMDQRSTVAWKAVTDCVILNDDFMYRYEHGVSA